MSANEKFRQLSPCLSNGERYDSSVLENGNDSFPDHPPVLRRIQMVQPSPVTALAGLGIRTRVVNHTFASEH
jgi:hypothetical protein